jgi:lycopene beta-cyclase
MMEQQGLNAPVTFMNSIYAFFTLSLSARAGRMLAMWIVVMVCQPIVFWTHGPSALYLGMSLAVCVQAGMVLVILAEAWGARRTVWTFLTVAVLAYLAELIGSSTGVPFGRYYYTSVLQPQWNGVPLLIPLAWLMMLPPAWAVAQIITADTRHARFFPLVAALAFTAWDLFLDPQMVGWNFWVWETPGPYFGIPLVNYLGWVLVSGAITWVVRPARLPVMPLFAVYVVTCLLQTVGQGVFWSQPGPAICGFLGMGGFIVLAARRVSASQHRAAVQDIIPTT